MDVRPIRNDRDHARALGRIDRLWGAPRGTPEARTLEVLVTLVDDYETRRHPIDPPDPHGAGGAHTGGPGGDDRELRARLRGDEREAPFDLGDDPATPRRPGHLRRCPRRPATPPAAQKGSRRRRPAHGVWVTAGEARPAAACHTDSGPFVRKCNSSPAAALAMAPLWHPNGTILPSLTIKTFARRVLERLRAKARRDRRGLTQEALHLLEAGLDESRRRTPADAVCEPVVAWKCLAGRWESARTAAEEIEEIYGARTPGREVAL